jgi:ATP-dependent Lhr-like helicase
MHFAKLVMHSRAARVRVGDSILWVAAEKAAAFRAVYPAAQFESPLATIGTAPGYDDALLTMVTGWLTHMGPITAERLGTTVSLPSAEIFKALLRLESTGAVLRGQFEGAETKPADADIEWCDRRLLARIHRLTLGSLRKQVEPVTAAVFMRWLARWQHVTPGTQAIGERGMFHILRQMQGFEIPANAWEKQVLARRVQHYDPEELDNLCLTGAVGWGRLSRIRRRWSLPRKARAGSFLQA